MTTQRILFVCTNQSSFVKEDLAILREKYSVTVLQISSKSRVSQFFSLLRQLIFLTFNIHRFSLVYIWFADYHSFLPILFCRILNKPSYIVAGGYDVCRIKKVGYGSFVNPVRGFMTKYSFTHCTRCLCVSAHVERVVRAIAPTAKTELVYNGISRFFTSESAYNQGFPILVELSGRTSHYSKKKRGVLCVASASSAQGIYIKGIDRYITAARLNPELSFALVGCAREVLEKHLVSEEKPGEQGGLGEQGGHDGPDGHDWPGKHSETVELKEKWPGLLPVNLILFPRLEQKDLKELYIRSKVYCQLSRSESFGVAMAEAMYYNCIPVYTAAGGLKEVAGEFGFMVSGKDPDEISTAIKRAYSIVEIPDSRERIGSLFTYKQRAEKLLAVINQER